MKPAELLGPKTRKGAHELSLRMVGAGLKGKDMRAAEVEWMYQAERWLPELLNEEYRERIQKVREKMRAQL